jgi:hypothetical protein
MNYKKPHSTTRILTTKYYPLPTIKKARKNDETQIIYDAAHHMFCSYPLHTPLLIYKHQHDQLSYDFYIERTESGWNDTVYTHLAPSNDDKTLYIMDGLSSAIQEAIEIQPQRLHMAEQLNIMCRLLDI